MEIARLVRSADFERVLRGRSKASSQHFAIHHVAGVSERPKKVQKQKLSTGGADVVALPVDDLPAEPSTTGLWLGAVVPKRHAKRAVTRTLFKRQIRSVAERRAERLVDGIWVVRLRAPFDRSHFVSAASDALRRAARVELEGLFDLAIQRAAVRA